MNEWKSIKNVTLDHYWAPRVAQNKTILLLFFFLKQKVKPTFPRSRMSDPGAVSKPRLVGLKAAALVFELTARFDHN